MKRFFHLKNDRKLVHYDGILGGDLALCGHDLVGDTTFGDYWSAAVETKMRVNCEDCLSVVKHVRGR